MMLQSTRPLVWVVIPAAGQGQRFGGTLPKQYAPLDQSTVLEHSVSGFLDLSWVAGIIVALAESDTHFDKLALALHPKIHRVMGGATRAESVWQSLSYLTNISPESWILVHDAARPGLTKADIIRLYTTLQAHPVGGLLGVPLNDTLKKVEPNLSISQTLPRTALWQAQTPQMFRLALLKQALQQQRESNIALSDEASAIEALGLSPQMVLGTTQNLKITYATDLALLRQSLASPKEAVMRIGHGYDIHRFMESELIQPSLMLGGIEVPYHQVLAAHSDGDVVIHALCDALLGAAGLGDIGQHFPDTDPQYYQQASDFFLIRVMEQLTALNYKVGNVDITIIAQAPKMSPYLAAMRENLAQLMQLAATQINLKATTHEHLDAIGQGQGLAVHAVAIIDAS
jgi:2-C-methyl-D-erythritol 4-phosphate cytidylyltransferase/2-C-methyl-D-erythritol 2,4-cyclodiphosphate synthase